MEEFRKDAWIEIVERCQDAGVDGSSAISPVRTVCRSGGWASAMGEMS